MRMQWVALTDAEGYGLLVATCPYQEGSEQSEPQPGSSPSAELADAIRTREYGPAPPLQVSASRFTIEELEAAKYAYGRVEFTWLTLGNACACT